MNSGTQLQLSIGEMFSILGVFLGVFVWVGQMLVSQITKRLSAKLDSLEATCTSLEAEVEQLNRQLPLEYVRREDWIRFSASIDSKLDRLAEMLMRQAPQGVPRA